MAAKAAAEPQDFGRCNSYNFCSEIYKVNIA